MKIFSIFLLFTLFVSCAEDSKFNADRRRMTNTNSGNSNGNGANGSTRTIVDRSSVQVDTFNLADIANFDESFSIPSSPLASETFTYQLPPNTPFSFNVDAAADRTENFTKNGTKKFEDIKSNRMTVYFVVDSSESFAAVASKKSRAKDIINGIAAQLSPQNYDLRFVICGLLDRTTISKEILLKPASKTLGDFQTEIAATLGRVFGSAGSGTERHFASMLSCYNGSQRHDEVNGLFVITDAPNGKTNDNVDDTSLNRQSPSSVDNHAYLLNAVLGQYSHMTFFGAMYRMTDGDCGNADAIENPIGETLFMNSQFADASKKYATNLGSGFSYAVGDFCAASLNTQVMTDFVSVLNTVRQRRIMTANTYEVFTEPEYAQRVYNDVNEVPLASIGSGRVFIGTSEITKAVYYQRNAYDKTSFGLSLVPESGSTVTLNLPGIGTVACLENSAFVGNEQCRWSSNIVYLKSVQSPIPVPAPNSNYAFTISYRNAVQKVRSVSTTSDTEIFNGSWSFETFPAASAALISGAQYQLSADKKTLTVNFSADLFPGAYKLNYIKRVAQNFTLASFVKNVGNSLFCHRDGSTASIQSGQIVINPSTAVVPCTLASDRKTVTYAHDAAQTQPFKISYLVDVSPRTDFELKNAPDLDSIVVKRSMIDGSNETTETNYIMNGKILVLSNALVAGWKLTVSYRFTPPLRDNIFILTSKAVSGTKYKVEYGKPGSLQTLLESNYNVLDGDPEKIELLAELKHGYMLQVTYSTVLEKSDQTK